jgi:hypothetical protein
VTAGSRGALSAPGWLCYVTAMSRALCLAVVVLGFAACKRPSVESCEEALRNYASLTYWEQAEVEIAAAPPAEREKLRAAKLAERDQPRSKRAWSSRSVSAARPATSTA